MVLHCENRWCGEQFEFDEGDLEHLRKFDVERLPHVCPRCRHQNRANFKGGLVFYKRASSYSGQGIVSLFGPSQPFPVYSISEWWSDLWDGLSYGREFRFDTPFFEQIADLHRAVPKIANYNHKIENADYSAYAGNGKNAYYCDVAYGCENVMYCDAVTGGCENLCDCLRCFKTSSHLYECTQCHNCHYSTHLYLCTDCRDSHFCVDCRGCSDCLFSSNLRNKQYYVFNKPVTSQEYARIEAQHIDGRYSTLQRNRGVWRKVLLEAAYRDLQLTNVENCTGDDLANSAHCKECYYCVNTIGGRYCLDLGASRQNVDSMDVTSAGIGELLYNCVGLGGGNYFMRMCWMARECSFCTYCIDCYSCRSCFGCTGLRGKQYCILNKQYSKEDYEILSSRIIESMRAEETWGDFFPSSMSPFSYNDSLAMKWFPLSKHEALTKGFRWAHIPEQHAEFNLSEPPDNISDASDDLCHEVLECRATGRKYKLTSQELSFYRTMNVPLPRFHADHRMSKRRTMLNPLRLWARTCAGCGGGISTSFAPDRAEKVFCGRCYNERLD